MRRIPQRFSPWLLVAGLVFVLEGCQSRPLAPRPPSIVLIMADDLGFSDLGSYGGEIPNALAGFIGQARIAFHAILQRCTVLSYASLSIDWPLSA